jgi:tetratricopeptide (TPR) repeat protein
LLDHFLLLRKDVAGSGEVRLSMLEMLREYALEQLQARGEVAATQQGHAYYCLALAEAASPELTGAQQVSWFERLEREYENLRAALRWAIAADEGEVGLRLAGALWRFWYTRGRLSEGRAWLAEFLALTGEDVAGRLAALRARALQGAGNLASQQGDHEQAEAYQTAALALYRALGDQEKIASTLNNMNLVSMRRGNYARATELVEESLAVYRTLGNTYNIALTLHNLGTLVHLQGWYDQAARLYEESLALRRSLRDARGIASTLNNWGDAAREQGHYPRATTLLEEALALYRDLGAKQGMATTLCNLGNMAYDRGKLKRARALGTQALHLVQEVGETWFYPAFLTLLGKIAYQHKEYGRAAALHEESLALRRSARDLPGIAESLAHLGQAAQAQGDAAQATALYEECLSTYHTLQIRHGVAPCLEGWAKLLLAQGNAEQAATLLGAAAALREEIGAPLPPIERAAYDRLLADTRLTLGAAGFSATWTAGQSMPVEGLLTEAQSAASRQDAIVPQKQGHQGPVLR